ncbi:DUF4279 domain-containing protein [Herbihabitans rhizosphaerae]|uniref:DUF4279 domain-containing protein n=1 Tax=Herbihabitans rhizosphaerae TaxID=1872711 RepID=UPI00102B95E7|nr:DUF4279 domain-containing protein [Herbihabitans rhizosphaerae]
MTQDRRIASFVVVSKDLTPADISRATGLQPDEEIWLGEKASRSSWARPEADHVWELVESGAENVDVSELIVRLYERISPAIAVLRSLKEVVDLGVLLRVVIYASSEDPIGPGFAVDATVLQSLVSVGARLDIDLYATD